MECVHQIEWFDEYVYVEFLDSVPFKRSTTTTVEEGHSIKTMINLSIVDLKMEIHSAVADQQTVKDYCTQRNWSNNKRVVSHVVVPPQTSLSPFACRTTLAPWLHWYPRLNRRGWRRTRTCLKRSLGSCTVRRPGMGSTHWEHQLHMLRRVAPPFRRVSGRSPHWYVFGWGPSCFYTAQRLAPNAHPLFVLRVPFSYVLRDPWVRSVEDGITGRQNNDGVCRLCWMYLEFFYIWVFIVIVYS